MMILHNRDGMAVSGRWTESTELAEIGKVHLPRLV